MTTSPITSAPTIDYRHGAPDNLDQLIELYQASTLAERRPMDDRAIVEQMLRHANLIITAWEGPTLLGIARTLTDFGYVAYVADLAVRSTYQHQGIGTELLRRTRVALGPRAMMVLLAAPAAVAYYPHIGFSHHPQAWILPPHAPFPRPRSS